MNETIKKILSIVLGYLFIKLVLKSCNDFHTVKIKKNNDYV